MATKSLQIKGSMHYVADEKIKMNLQCYCFKKSYEVIFAQFGLISGICFCVSVHILGAFDKMSTEKL